MDYSKIKDVISLDKSSDKPSDVFVMAQAVIDDLLKIGWHPDQIIDVIKALTKDEKEYTESAIHDWVWDDYEIFKNLGISMATHRPIANEIRRFVDITEAEDIYLSEVYEDLKIISPGDRAAAQKAFQRLSSQDGMLIKVGRGYYRKKRINIKKMQLFCVPTDEFPIIMPLNLNEICGLYPRNIIIIAGTKGAGKTTFMLNIVTANQHRIPVVYINSEMGEIEFTKRLMLFGGKKDDWKFDAYEIKTPEEIYDLVTIEKKIFIVDYIEQHDTFYKVAEKIQEIHKRLKDGICLIALQKDPVAEMGRGKDFSAEKSRLYITLDYVKGQNMSLAKIWDAKEPKGRDTVRGGMINYKIITGHKISPLGNWRFP